MHTCSSVIFQHTGSFDTLDPHPQQTVCFQDPISIQDYNVSFHNYSAIYILPVYVSKQGESRHRTYEINVFDADAWQDILALKKPCTMKVNEK